MVSSTVKIYLIAVHTSIAGMLWGLDTGSIGAITQMAQFDESIGRLPTGTLGIYVSCILLSASISSLCSGYVADLLSRKYAIMTGGLIFAIGAILSASATTYPMLLCARLITGVGQGQSISVVTIYLCELAPHRIRGTVATMLQMLITVGIAAGFFIAYGSSRLHGSLAWRTPFIVEAAHGIILASGMLFVPYSPRWLVQRGRFDEAKSVLQKYRDSEDVEDELLSIRGSLEDRSTPQASFSEVFAKRYIRRSALGIFIMAFMMLSGVDTVLYYAPILFAQAGFPSQRASFLASGVSGIVNLLCTIPAQLWVDKWGRKIPLIGGGLAMSVCYLGIGTLYAIYGEKVNGEIRINGKAPQWAVIALIYIFIGNFAWSWAVVIKVYACEIMPTRLRAKACAIQQLANWMVNFTVTLTAPMFLRASPSGPYFLFCSATFFTSVVCYLFMPETKEKSLEEIEELFEKKTGSSESQLNTKL
ncbi:general substrate transporter [Pisolithus orientalis]|uniref:general substrate transporter n=1 Tax=Pisolithus orientalis TaxID=936130 RepID=UPI0022246BFA|nr:general substrate transporter [Pisolithus orientalis]KAI6015343.1 general substrate transporter [Pisolithus orientalis]